MYYHLNIYVVQQVYGRIHDFKMGGGGGGVVIFFFKLLKNYNKFKLNLNINI